MKIIPKIIVFIVNSHFLDKNERFLWQVEKIAFDDRLW